MAQTNDTLTAIAVKRLSGKAHTSELLGLALEPKGSTVQTAATTVFAEAFPNDPAKTLFLAQSESLSAPGTTMYVEFELYAFGSEYTSPDTDNPGADTYHAYGLILSTSFDDGISNSDFDNLTSTPTAKGSFPFVGGSYMSGSRGRLQIIPEFVSNLTAGQNAPNPYTPQLFGTNASESEIAPNSGIDWYLDAYSGILFIENPVDYGTPGSPNAGAEVPGKIRAFMYTGKYQDQVTFSADDVGLHLSASEGTGFSLGNDATASFTSGSGEGLTVTAGPTNNIEFELVNVVSGSAQLPGFNVSASTSTNNFDISLGDTASFIDGGAGLTVETVASNKVQIGKITDNVQFANLTGSNLLITNTASITYFETTYESSSIIYSSGSTKFGDTNDDTHVFTGSVAILYTGSGPVGPEYGLQMSGSNFLIDYGNSGSVTLGTHNVGFEIGSSLPITGSGLIISQSFTNEATTHNMVKIGETELIDVSGSQFGTDSFLINVRKKTLVISSSEFNKPAARIEAGNTAFYGSTSNKEVITIANDVVNIGTNTANTNVNAATLFLLPATSLNMGVGNNQEDDLSYNANKSLLIGQSADIDNGTNGAQVKAAFLSNIFPLFKGAVTASAVSSSGLLFASASEGLGGSDIAVAMYNTVTGQFYHTGSSALGDTTLLEASASAGIFLSASEGTGFSIGLMQSASFTSGSGTGLTVEAGVGTNNIEFTLVGVLSSSAQIATDISGAIDAATGSVLLNYGLLSGSAQIATDISGAIDAATGSLSSSIIGTDYEIEVTSTNPGNVTIGLPDAVRISSSLQVGTNGNDPDDATITTSHATFNLLNENATTINFGGDATTINMGAAGASNVSIKGSASIDGDLIVKGTTTSINTDQLLVEDPFILLASSSSDPNTDGGIIIQTDASANGTALFYDRSSNRWALAQSSSVAHDVGASSAVAQQFVVSVSSSAANPIGTPSNFGNSSTAQLGMMYVATTDNDGDTNTIWIYG